MSIPYGRLAPHLLMATTIAGAVTGVAGAVQAQTTEPKFEVYGFAQVDFTQDFNRVDPLWDDALRPSKIPTTEGTFGDDGQTSVSVKQTRFGVKAQQDIAGKPLFVKFEFDLFGVGGDAGQTTFRLRHAYGQWGPVTAGQTDSAFMDMSIFPNTVEYWGPTGMVFVRTPQVRYTFESGASRFVVALEKPSNDIDPGNVRVISPEIGDNLQGDEELPDLTGHYRYAGDWGHMQLAGILRRVGYETADTPGNEPADSKMGWGVNLTSNIKVGAKDVVHLGAVYGEGIASYMNDGGTDLGPELSTGATLPLPDPVPPGTLRGDVLPLLGLTAYYDHYWNDQWSSSIGWSMTKVENTDFQNGDAFQTGQYASANLLYTPDPRILAGAELLWGEREDFDGNKGNDLRVQVSFKYSFSSNDFR
jgi:hypothetical protein